MRYIFNAAEASTSGTLEGSLTNMAAPIGISCLSNVAKCCNGVVRNLRTTRNISWRFLSTTNAGILLLLIKTTIYYSQVMFSCVAKDGSHVRKIT